MPAPRPHHCPVPPGQPGRRTQWEALHLVSQLWACPPKKPGSGQLWACSPDPVFLGGRPRVCKVCAAQRCAMVHRPRARTQRHETARHPPAQMRRRAALRSRRWTASYATWPVAAAQVARPSRRGSARHRPARMRRRAMAHRLQAGTTRRSWVIILRCPGTFGSCPASAVGSPGAQFRRHWPVGIHMEVGLCPGTAVERSVPDLSKEVLDHVRHSTSINWLVPAKPHSQGNRGGAQAPRFHAPSGGCDGGTGDGDGEAMSSSTHGKTGPSS
eukprot:gene14756-biopygen21670